MVSRPKVAAGTLAAVFLTIGGSALAQQASRWHQFIERARERRAHEADPKMTPIHGPGDYRFSFAHGGITREYLVHVPKSYRGAPSPMLIALHGGGGDSDFQADDSKYRIIGKSEQAGFIAVFPNGYSRWPSGILATWNAGTCCGPAAKDKIDDVGFIREMIHRVERQARIDPRRIFATGMSNGAMMSWRLACEAPEIRAIAPVAGSDNTPSCTPQRPVPIIEFHALNDDHVPFNGGKGDLSVAQVDFVSVPATQAKWVRLNRADARANRVLSVSGAHCDLHRARAGGAPVELCVTDGGGHSWPGGGTQEGHKQPSRAISANDLMWHFFSSL
ncbi:MAG TPA: PHB depolymerase family esterase [Sphingomicrobium sp.]|nr:PHB depolymerase family esterase [Sphingomicrobium sp.]